MNLTRMFGLFVCWPLKGNCPGVYHMRGDVVVARAEFKCVVNWRGEGQRRDAKKTNRGCVEMNYIDCRDLYDEQPYCKYVCQRLLFCLLLVRVGGSVCYQPEPLFWWMSADGTQEIGTTQKRLLLDWSGYGNDSKQNRVHLKHDIASKKKITISYLFIYLFFQIGRKLKRGEILWVW